MTSIKLIYYSWPTYLLSLVTIILAAIITFHTDVLFLVRIHY